MSKAILVMDMPENCVRCKLQDWMNCRIVKGCHTGETRPIWCPLKPVPDKKAHTENVLEVFVNTGYNACIDEILGEKESD